MLIYKIVHREEWGYAEGQAVYAGSAKDREDHFMHFSSAHQVIGTLNKYYDGADDLLLVAVESDLLGDALKFEPSRDGALFPHLYGTLPTTSAKWVRPIPRDASGRFALPSECI